MLLRSSSTPVLGSLLSSFAESPGNNHYHSEVLYPSPKQTPTSIHHSCNKLSYNHNSGPQNVTSFFCNSSPISPSVAEFSTSNKPPLRGFRRIQSDGNLEGLANMASLEVDEFSLNPVKKFPRKPSIAHLEAIPSFSFHNSGKTREDEESEDEEEEEDRKDVLFFDGTGQFQINDMGFKREVQYIDEHRQEMHLARGLGVSDLSLVNGSSHGGGNGGRGGYKPVDFERDGGGDGQEINFEEHYRKMLEEDPSNSLLLRNYAQFLLQTKGDLQGAEEYYSRAILADPGDGEILAQYAKLEWELHRDKDRATDYFERAVYAASDDSNVHAAYASFLWETEDEEDENEEPTDTHVSSPLIHKSVPASALLIS